MMDFNIDLMFGFLVWSGLCLVLLVAERIRSLYWKRAARTMECHANSLQAVLDATPPERLERPWDSIPTGVIVHPDGPLHDADEPTLMDIMALGKSGSYDDDG